MQQVDVQGSPPMWRSGLVTAWRVGGFHRPGLVLWSDRLFYALARLAALAVIGLTILLVVELFRGSSEAIRHFGIGFISGTTWDPVKEQFGTLPTIIGTLIKGALALLLAVPIAIGTAIYIVFYAPPRLSVVLSYMAESLAAIPSVIYGLWALFILVPIIRSVQVWLKAHFGWFQPFNGPANYGVGILAGSVILAIMITPIIVALSRDLIRAVPRTQAEGMRALGATKWESIWHGVLPYARSGLVGAVVLGLGRALGETMAVTMVGGNAIRLTHSLFDPVASMSSQIANEFSEATSSLYVSSLIYVGLVLFAITILVNLAALWLIWRVSKGTHAIRE